MAKRFVGFDTETDLIQPDVPAPTLVCGSFADPLRQWGAPWVELDQDTLKTVEGYLKDEEVVLAIHNAPFDLGVIVAHNPDLLPYIWRALENGRVWDTQIVQRILDNEEGMLEAPNYRANLAALAMRYWAVDLSAEKNDPSSYRMRYIQLHRVPLHRWPEKALSYAADDAKYHLRLCSSQRQIMGRDELSPYMRRQIHAAFALRLMTLEGVTCDPAKVNETIDQITTDIARAKDDLVDTGLLRKTGSKNIKAIRELVAAAYNGAPPLTASGAASYARDVLRQSGDHTLEALADYAEAEKLASTYLETFRQGAESKVCPGYWMMKATGRTSSSRPNIQQIKRSLRGVFWAREGMVLIWADYSQIELVVLAQACIDLLGWSRLADAINEGVDVHALIVEKILGEEYDPKRADHKALRQIAKGVNYGVPGFMREEKLTATLNKMIRDVNKGRSTEDQIDVEIVEWESDLARQPTRRQYSAEHLIEVHRELFPDVHEYLRNAARMTRLGAMVELPRIGLRRKTDRATAYANTGFQAPAAYGALGAVIETQRQCYLDWSSPLYGCHGWAFVHDEIVCEGPEAGAEAALERLKKIMVDEMQAIVPDVKVSVDGSYGRHWGK